MESKRQLVAIMFADIAGYNKIMEENEAEAQPLTASNYRSYKDRFIPALQSRGTHQLMSDIELESSLRSSIQ